MQVLQFATILRWNGNVKRKTILRSNMILPLSGLSNFVKILRRHFRINRPFLCTMASHKQHCRFAAIDRLGKWHPPSTRLGDPNYFLLFSLLLSLVSLYVRIMGYNS